MVTATLRLPGDLLRIIGVIIAAGLARPAAVVAQGSDSVATAALSDSGVVVRFPRFVSPDSITREMPVADLFSGYEWRVALLGHDTALLAALVVPPNDSLLIHRYGSIKEVYMTGDLRSCQRTNDLVISCSRLARGLVRDVDGSIEIAIIDSRWLLMAMQLDHPTVRLIVKRARQILWSADVPLVNHMP
jgi:hypothetical protein